jgi:hypothetical protein
MNFHHTMLFKGFLSSKCRLARSLDCERGWCLELLVMWLTVAQIVLIVRFVPDALFKKERLRLDWNFCFIRNPADATEIMDSPTFHSSDDDGTRPWMVPLLTLLIVGLAIVFYWHTRSRPFDVDSPHYIKIAEGRIAEVRKPFTARILQPAIAGFIARTTGLAIESSFFVTNLACLAALVSAGLVLIRQHVRSIGFALAIVLCPMTLMLFREIYMPDCMHAALVAVFFLLLSRGAWWYAVPLLFVMQVTRDSTVLLTFVLVLVGAYHRKWGLIGAALLATVLGIVVVGRVASHGQSNIHEQNTIMYLVGKVPFNVLTNVCGIRMWSDTHATDNPTEFPGEPVFKLDLPRWVPSGAMRQIGIHHFDFGIPLMLARIMATLFGVMLSVVLVVMVWRRWRLMRADGLSFSGLLALTYGFAAFLLGPAIGASIGRLVAYAWPMAWIAAPELLVRYFNTSDGLIRKLTWLQVIACWTPLVIREVGFEIGPSNVGANLIAVIVALSCHVVAMKALWRSRLA